MLESSSDVEFKIFSLLAKDDFVCTGSFALEHSSVLLYGNHIYMLSSFKIFLINFCYFLSLCL